MRDERDDVSEPGGTAPGVTPRAAGDAPAPDAPAPETHVPPPVAANAGATDTSAPGPAPAATPAAIPAATRTVTPGGWRALISEPPEVVISRPRVSLAAQSRRDFLMLAAGTLAAA